MIGPLPPSSGAGETVGPTTRKRDQACEDFESLFLHKMLQVMRETVQEDGILGGSNAMKIQQDLLDQELAKTMAQRGIGLGEMLQRQLSKSASQEIKDNADNTSRHGPHGL